MSYAIVRNEKLTRAEINGKGTHNDRKAKNHTNKDIDPTRTHLNYYIKKNKPNIIYSIGSSHKYGNKQNYIYRAYQGCKRLINYHFLVYFNATNHNYPSNPPTLGPIALRIDCGQ